jgi:hypothetical protein
MVDGELFDKLAKIACTLRKSTAPFGGIQVSLNSESCTQFLTLLISLSLLGTSSSYHLLLTRVNLYSHSKLTNGRDVFLICSD